MAKKLNRCPASESKPRYRETGKEDNPLAELCTPEMFCQYLINVMCAKLEEPASPPDPEKTDLDYWL